MVRPCWGVESLLLHSRELSSLGLNQDCGYSGGEKATPILLQVERVTVGTFLEFVSLTHCFLEFCVGDQKGGRTGHTHPCEHNPIALPSCSHH